MSISRRNFLKNGSLMALAVGVPVSLSKMAAATEKTLRSNEFGLKEALRANEGDLNKAAFLAQLNTDFLFADGVSKVAVRLVEVSDLPRRGESARKEAFSLVFRGNRARALKQNTYLIEHNQLGKFSFLIVPIMRKDKSAPYYEAVINQLYP